MKYEKNGTLFSIGDPNDISFIASSIFNNGKIVTKECRSFIDHLYSLPEFEFPDSSWSSEQSLWFSMVKDSLFMAKGSDVSSIIEQEKNKYLEELAAGKKTNGISLQINSICNFSCKYCIAKNKVEEKSGMSFDIAKEAIDKFLSFRLEDKSFNHFHLSYVGKEPLLSFPIIQDVENYLTIVEAELVQSNRAISHSSSFISNLSLANDKIIEFCKNHNIEITGSLDGNKSANDLNRVFTVSDTASVYDSVCEKLRLFQKYNYPVKTLNMVITKNSLRVLDPITFISDMKAFGVETLGVSFDATKPGDISTSEKIQILNQLMDTAGKNGISISGEFGKAFSTLTGKTMPVAHCNGESGSNILVDANGNIKLCNYLGKLDADIKGLSDAFAPGGSVFESVKGYLTGNPRCAGCPLEGSCLGGCAAVVTDDYSDAERDLFCKEAKTLTENLVKNAIAMFKASRM